ncbi:hypothetical protein Mgra_00000166 [Meloidogyne graminicola]|uniref:Uncharacterized protein n=1 Tax=Meloidogyne graminicola TaxID=189291 RepID=A0A8T0A4R4_9BILA|nr:hypothetical protein Mgra_00000166 [Meloidogyne graminicola]
MCLRPLPNIIPEKRSHNFADHFWQNNQQQNRNLNRPWNLFEHLPKVKIGESELSKITPFERKMIGMATTMFECSFLFIATFSALLSIFRVKIEKTATPIFSFIMPSINEEQTNN